MKVIMLQKKVATNVIGTDPEHALVIFNQGCSEVEYFDTNAVSIIESNVPNAYAQTMEFVHATGTYVLGSELRQEDFPDKALKVWFVTVDLEFVVDYKKVETVDQLAQRREKPTTEHLRPNPYQQEGKPGWYFWDETETEHGPYRDKVTAEQQYTDYVNWLNTGQVTVRQEEASDTDSIPDPNDKPVVKEIPSTIPALDELPG